MSRAFVREPENDTVDLPDRPVSPHPNFVTEAGRVAIENALNRFEAAYKAAIAKGDQRAVAADLREVRYWRKRRASAEVVKASEGDIHARFGARVTIRAGGMTQFDEVRGGGSYLSQNDLRLHFGLASATKIDYVEVRWPTGKVESFKEIAVDKIYTIVEGKGIQNSAPFNDLPARLP